MLWASIKLKLNKPLHPKFLVFFLFWNMRIDDKGNGSFQHALPVDGSELHVVLSWELF